MDVKLRRVDSCAAVDVTGSLDIHSSPQLRSICLDLIRSRVPKVIINLKDVMYLDSSAVATLVECLQGLAEYGGKLAICGISPRVREIFEITNLSRIFEFYGSEAEALSSCAGAAAPGAAPAGKVQRRT
jgi:anti-sigma B factor antagonist